MTCRWFADSLKVFHKGGGRIPPLQAYPPLRRVEARVLPEEPFFSIPAPLQFQMARFAGLTKMLSYVTLGSFAPRIGAVLCGFRPMVHSDAEPNCREHGPHAMCRPLSL